MTVPRRGFDDLDGPVEAAMGRRVPLRPLPSLAAAVDEYARRVAAGDDREQKQRLSSYKAALGPAIRSGVLPLGLWERESRRRIRISEPGLQAIANDLRHHFAPTPGYVFLDADYRSAHMHIAAARVGDDKLRARLSGDVDFYEDIARRLLSSVDVDPTRARKPTKRALLALLNGGDAATIARYLAEIGTPIDKALAANRGARLEDWFWREYPALAAYKQRQIDHCAATPAKAYRVDTLTGRITTIDVSKKAPESAWRSMLSAKWTLVESEALDYALIDLHRTLARYEGRLVLPMFDGLLVEVRQDLAASARTSLMRLMDLSMQRAGVAGVPATVDVRERWGEPPPP